MEDVREDRDPHVRPSHRESIQFFFLSIGSLLDTPWGRRTTVNTLENGHTPILNKIKEHLLWKNGCWVSFDEFTICARLKVFAAFDEASICARFKGFATSVHCLCRVSSEVSTTRDLPQRKVVRFTVFYSLVTPRISSRDFQKGQEMEKHLSHAPEKAERERDSRVQGVVARFF